MSVEQPMNQLILYALEFYNPSSGLDKFLDRFNLGEFNLR